MTLTSRITSIAARTLRAAARAALRLADRLDSMAPHGGAPSNRAPAETDVFQPQDDQLEDGGSPDGGTMAVYPDHSGPGFVSVTHEGEIARAYRLADEALAGRSLAVVMREATMPLADAVRIVRGEQISPAPGSASRSTQGPGSLRAPDPARMKQLEIERLLRAMAVTKGGSGHREKLISLGLPAAEIDARVGPMLAAHARQTEAAERAFYGDRGQSR